MARDSAHGPNAVARAAHRTGGSGGAVVPSGKATVRPYVQRRKEELGLTARETFVPQVYDWGGEAQMDWYEANANFAGE